MAITLRQKILLTINVVKQSNIFDGMIIFCNFKKELRQFLDLYNKKNYFDLSFLDNLRINSQTSTLEDGKKDNFYSGGRPGHEGSIKNVKKYIYS